MNHIYGTDILQKRIAKLNADNEAAISEISMIKAELEQLRMTRIVPDDSACWLVKVGAVAFFASLGAWYLLAKVGWL